MSAMRSALLDLVGPGGLREGRNLGPYLVDATEVRGLAGKADFAVAPGSADELAAVLAWCFQSDVPVTPRGGGTGYAGGAVPAEGVVVSTERLTAIRELEPLLWRAKVEAGVTTATLRRRARENGLLYPPDPGAGEESQLGGNVATNAGGPHAFKYGVTGAWVTGLEAVLMSGETIDLGGSIRKDVAGYDLISLIVGSEGTLAVVTAVDVRLIPAPEAALPVVAGYADAQAGEQAIQACLASGIIPAAIEFLDGAAVEVVKAALPVDLGDSGFAVIAEADGSQEEAAAGRQALIEAMGEGAVTLHAPEGRGEVDALWRWREGVGIAADSVLGGKVSEDVVVPVERLADAVEANAEIAARHGLAHCCWGHAGDGNLHATFMFDRTDESAVRRAGDAAAELFEAAIEMGGSVSGEHGLGSVKAGQLRHQWPQSAVNLHEGVKDLFDPKGLLNLGKKVP